MPIMSSLEQAWCRSAPWRVFAQRVVLPWAIGDADLHGDVLELGSGSGAMAEQLLERYPRIRLTATDIDPRMCDAASRRLDRFGDRAVVKAADATHLPFDDRSFDAVVSFVMLHHVIDWERALDEVARVLRPGGLLVGYDLADTRMSRITGRLPGSPHRMARTDDLRRHLEQLPFSQVAVTRRVAGQVSRFRATKT